MRRERERERERAERSFLLLLLNGGRGIYSVFDLLFIVLLLLLLFGVWCAYGLFGDPPKSGSLSLSPYFEQGRMRGGDSQKKGRRANLNLGRGQFEFCSTS